ncbi:MAG: hypothetical protein K0S41_2986 [Anaerocolumna sp.]|nr:hypothetical protein [Anaerocolumna sp.]
MPKYYTDNHLSHNNTMIFSGSGVVYTDPDTAIIRLGVQSTGENLQQIQYDNAETVHKIIEALKEYGITDIKTFQYSIDKLYDYVEGARVDRGYSVRNILEIKLKELDQVGFVIDTAVENGANVVEFISFEVEDTDIFYLQALNLSILDAFEKAKSVSSLLGLEMLPVPMRIVENSSSPIPLANRYASGERMVVTPIEPGQKEIKANVTVEFMF